MAKAIMVQGTMSSAGKSILVTGLCRLFHRNGLRTAPFKSQNMTRKSFICSDGLEMGNAQAIQAEAACALPCVHMNPILLKPCSNTKSEVIVLGKAVGTMDAVEYYKFRPSIKTVVSEAFTALSKANDIVVIEGAGSPAEINLSSDDIVNMGMAEIADSPVILVADIDRGGVFAQIYGTIMLLPPHQRRRIKGIVINKFRGATEILRPGIEMIEKLCSVPVLGVLPYLDIEIEDEDSLTVSPPRPKAPDTADFRSSQYDLLAEAFREYLDTNAIYRILEGHI
ncbi:MAG: cobyric acid synthase [Oscillospiraceae bacterium]|nr:cobyric acid synthase [Oscillospiraceae bacterium]